MDNTMTMKEKIQLFEDRKVRTAWDSEREKWYFSIADVCGVLVDQPDYEKARKYWNKLTGIPSEMLLKRVSIGSLRLPMLESS